MKKTINALIVYNILLTILVLYFISGKNEHPIKANETFEEITVERINVVEKDGKPKMIITNKERQPTGLDIDGEHYEYGRGKAGGILIYNDEGEEMGGYLFSGDKNEHGGMISFDQYKSDQLLQIKTSEIMRNGKREKLYGLALWARPDSITTKEIMIEEQRIQKLATEEERDKEYQRLDSLGFYGANTFFAGRLWSGSTGLFLSDQKGNSRINIYVNKNGEPKMCFYDADGNTIPFSEVVNNSK